MVELYELSAREAVRQVADGVTTVEALVRSSLERIAHLEPVIGAWQYLDEERALREARARDSAPTKGPLHGTLIGIKDVIDTADMPTTYGSAAYAHHRPPYDAACVALFRAAGAMAFGKTVSTEFAGASPGKTRHPQDESHTPGGSSSGSAAAVAAKMVPIALGTQTAGSVIRPASFCGVVGYKPTYGTIDRTGVKTLAASFDTIGIMARNVRDVAFFTAIVAGRPKLAVPDLLDAPSIGLYRTECWHLAEPATVAALDRACAALEKRGVSIREIPLVPGYDDLLSIHEQIMAWDMLSALSYEHLFLADKITAKSLDMFTTRKPLATPDIYDAAQARAYKARAGLDTLFGEHDVLLTPSAPGEAPVGLDSTGDASFNRPWTMLHAPCVTVPAGVGPTGLPVGVQVVGRIGQDAKTLAAAAFVEAALADY